MAFSSFQIDKHPDRLVSKIDSNKTQENSQTLNEASNYLYIYSGPVPDYQKGKEIEPDNTAKGNEECITYTNSKMK